MKKIITGLILFYQYFISPLIGPRCRYSPTCSNYMKDAVHIHGPWKGSIFGIKRFCKCHPFAKKHFEKTKGYDPVPNKIN